MAGLLVVKRIEISFGGRYGSGHTWWRPRWLDPGVDGRRVQGQAAPATDTQDADALRVYAVLNREEIHRCLEVLGVDVRGGHVAGQPPLSPVKEGSKARVRKPRSARLA